MKRLYAEDTLAGPSNLKVEVRSEPSSRMAWGDSRSNFARRNVCGGGYSGEASMVKVTGGFSGTVALTASGQPSGVTVGFSPDSLLNPGAADIPARAFIRPDPFGLPQPVAKS